MPRLGGVASGVFGLVGKAQPFRSSGGEAEWQKLAGWDGRSGDDRKRFCRECKQKVDNLSEMTRR